MIDMNARTENNEIPTDWTRTNFIVNYDSINNQSPISIFNEASKVYTEAAKKREEVLLASAIGRQAPVQDFETLRQQLADEYIIARENTLIDAAIDATDLGVDSRKIREYVASLNPIDPEYAKNYSLEVMSPMHERAKALEENEELVNFEYNPQNDTVGPLEAQISAGNLIRKFADGLTIDTAPEMVEKAFWTISKFIPGIDYAEIQMTDPLNVKKGFSTITTRKAQQEVIWNIALDPNTTDEEKFAAFSLITQQLPIGERDSFWQDMYKTPSILPDLGFIGDMLAGLSYGKRLANLTSKRYDVLSEAAKAGNKSAVVDETIKILDEDRMVFDQSPEKQGRLLTYITDTAVHPDPSPIKPNYRRATEAEVYERAVNTETAKKLKDIVRPEPMTDEQKVRQYEAFKAEVERNILEKAPKKDILGYVQINPKYQDDGAIESIIDIGTGSDGSFSFVSKEAAEKAAEKILPFNKEQYTVYTDGNGWKIRAKVTVPEQGHVLKDKWGGEYKTGLLGGRYLSRRTYLPKIQHAQDQALFTGKQAAKDLLDTEYLAKYDALSKAEKEGLNAVANEGVLSRKWYTDEYLRSEKGFTDAQIAAYNADHDLSDLNWLSANDSIVRDFNRRGYKVVRAKGEDYLGIKIEGLTEDAYKDASFLDTNTGTTYDFGQITPEVWREMKEKGYSMYRLRAPLLEDIGGETIPVRYIIGSETTVKDLPKIMLSYIEGGHLRYADNSLYIKQFRHITRNGKTYILTPKTLYAELDGVAARKYTKEVNDALGTYRKYRNGLMSKEAASVKLNNETAVNDYFVVGSVDDLEGYIRSKANPNGVLEWDTDLEVVRGGEELRQVGIAKAKGALELYDKDDIDNVNSIFDLVEQNGKGYWMRGKEPLKDLQGNVAVVVDTRRMMERNINDIVYNDFKRPYIEWNAREFRETFGDILDEDLLHSLTDDELMMSQDVVKKPAKGADMSRYNAAKYMQQNYQIKAGVKTDADRTVESFMTHLAESIADNSFMKKYNLMQRGSRGFEFIQRMDPQDTLKAINFQTTFGWWNIAQYPTQLAGTLTSILISPRASTKILSGYSSILGALTAKDERHYAEAIKSMMFDNKFTKAEADGLIDYLKRVSINDSAYRRTGSGTAIGRGLKGISDTNLVFFRSAERVNAVTANGAAYLEYMQAHPELLGKKLLNKHIVEILGRADDIYGNMTKGSDSLFQSSVWTKLAAQYSAFPTAQLEGILGRHLTNQEKARLGIGNLLFYGAGGTLGIGSAWMYRHLREEGLPETISEGLVYGWGEAIATSAGLPMTISQYGPGILGSGWAKFTTDFIDDGTIKLLNGIPATNTVKILKDSPKTFYEALMAAKAMLVPGETDADFYEHIINITHLSTPSSLGKYATAALALKYNKLFNKRGEVTKRDTDVLDVTLYLLGLDRSEQEVYEILRSGVVEKDLSMKEFMIKAEQLYSTYNTTKSLGAKEDYSNFIADAEKTMTNEEKSLFGVMLRNMQGNQKGWRTLNERYMNNFYRRKFKGSKFSKEELEITKDKKIKGAKQ